MGYADKTLECVECGASFTFTASEQEFFATKGYTNEPKRCPQCRQANKQRRGGSFGSYDGSGSQRPRQMYPAVCASCGKETQVPFEPRNGRPVYCSDCYRKVKPSR
ncbi:MAG: zinc-ribbon domain containing protein, partial [Chloroflexi bacterium]|nr:zinc-ribbon domain containing protein [Chloroflexota bacterium]